MYSHDETNVYTKNKINLIIFIFYIKINYLFILLINFLQMINLYTEYLSNSRNCLFYFDYYSI